MEELPASSAGESASRLKSPLAESTKRAPPLVILLNPYPEVGVKSSRQLTT
jgi:hypothetical protein